MDEPERWDDNFLKNASKPINSSGRNRYGTGRMNENVRRPFWIRQGQRSESPFFYYKKKKLKKFTEKKNSGPERRMNGGRRPRDCPEASNYDWPSDRPFSNWWRHPVVTQMNHNAIHSNFYDCVDHKSPRWDLWHPSPTGGTWRQSTGNVF